MKFFSIIIILLSVSLQCFAEIEEDPIKRTYLKIDLEDIDKKIINYCQYQDFNTCIDLVQQKSIIIKKLYGENSEEYTTILCTLQELLFQKGEYKRVLELTENLSNLFNQLSLKMNPIYYNFLYTTAYSYYYIKDFKNFIYYCNELLKISKNTNSFTKEIISLLYNDLAIACIYINELSEAIYYNNLASNLIIQQLGTENFFYGLNLYTKAVIELEKYNLNKSLQYGLEANRLIAEYIDNNNIFYIQSIMLLSVIYNNLGNQEKSLEYNKLALENISILYGEEDVVYVANLSNHADLLVFNEQYYDAIKVSEKALYIYESLVDKDPMLQASLLQTLGICYKAVEDWNNTIKIENKALNIIKNTHGMNNDSYIHMLLNQLNTYREIRDLTKAFQIAEEVIHCYDQKLKNYKIDWENDSSMLKARIMDSFSILYSEGSDYEGALNAAINAKEIYENHKIINKDYARIICNIASFYIGMGLESDKNEYFDMAVGYGIQANNVIERIEGKANTIYFLALMNISNAYFYKKDYSLSFDYNKRAYDVIVNILGGNHTKSIRSGTNLINNCYYTSKASELVYYIHKIIPLRFKYILHGIPYLISRDRAKFLKDEKHFFEKELPLYAYTIPNDTLIQYTFNGFLLTKGCILNTEIELAALIAESGDKVAEEMYQRLLLNRRQLNKLYEKPKNERYIDTDSLENEQEELERELISRSKVFGDYTRNLTIDWKEVQASLTDDDIAIEFVSFPTENDSVMYCALTLKKGYESPRMIPLFEAHELQRLNVDGYYTTTRLSNIVWKPLAEEMNDIKNVYFSPAGELYNIAIEYLPYSDNKDYIFDHWNLYRLSSTRELVISKDKQNKLESTVLYGGLDFSADITTMDKTATLDNSYLALNRSLVDSLNIRGNLKHLPGSQYEIEYIDSLLSKQDISTTLFMGKDGSETSFKALNGKRISHIHIATHGFYWSESDTYNDKDKLEFAFMQNYNDQRFIEDKAMTRSGLAFAGANDVLNHKEIPEGYDDGILTAQEIASIDLRGLDLLVLSACQTGLGEIKGDGVFGLQRGFKKAGAQTIVMSLWKVDDEATQMLMKYFYNNLIIGYDKHTALQEAQKSVRNTPGYEDPLYWAGFIILDAL